MRKSIIILSLCALLLTASRLAVGSLQAQRHEREFIAFGPVLVRSGRNTLSNHPELITENRLKKMETSHTPGPWKAHFGPGYTDISHVN